MLRCEMLKWLAIIIADLVLGSLLYVLHFCLPCLNFFANFTVFLYCAPHALCGSLYFFTASAKLVVLNKENFDKVIGVTEIALVNFHADWCRFSQMLAPVFSEAASRFQGDPRVVFGTVDCDKQSELASRFHINKYPTLKIFRNGEVARREYRGARSVSAFVQYITDQLADVIQIVTNEESVRELLVAKKANIFVQVHDTASPLWHSIKKLASSFREDCVFFALLHVPIEKQKLLYYSMTANTEEYSDSLDNLDAVHSWVSNKCLPLVREITFENAEELTEEGLPFLILFYKPNDKDIIKVYTDQVMQQLLDQKSSINFLYADGNTFAHPLQHLGKSIKDLPVLAIDSFRHMYLFPDIKDLTVPGKLKQFVLDLHSGKLHREFHDGPDPVTAASPVVVQDNNVVFDTSSKPVENPTVTPVAESVFIKLKPSQSRYTVLRDEL
ncbi:Endoplasmic reticulum resident protein 44 [Trichinella pseudospiralis]|uniref:Endoplasmic reticulum resident protein 44 n=2 Tax=Trichinella pseudospiralis TaxID=6337 RepID=A0A0V1FN99_TRIPS|nr:Endoplasmic reticulum resident protein 44 [Trichinella pseudospiralis]